MSSRNSAFDMGLTLLAVGGLILVTLVWKVQGVTGASFGNAMQATAAALGGIVLAWVLSHVMGGMNWLIAGLTLSLVWPCCWGLLDDVGALYGPVFSPYIPYEMPFYTSTYFKYAVEALFIIGGPTMQARNNW